MHALAHTLVTAGPTLSAPRHACPILPTIIWSMDSTAVWVRMYSTCSSRGRVESDAKNETATKCDVTDSGAASGQSTSDTTKPSPPTPLR